MDYHLNPKFPNNNRNKLLTVLYHAILNLHEHLKVAHTLKIGVTLIFNTKYTDVLHKYCNFLQRNMKTYCFILNLRKMILNN